MIGDEFFSAGLVKHACSFLTLFYPSYASFKALNSQSDDDDEEWLAFWVVLGVSYFIEFWCEGLLAQLPLYWLIKIIFVLWLQLPQFRGADYLYETVMQPFFVKYEAQIDAGLAEAKVFIIQKLKFLFSKLIEQINAAGNQQKEKVTEAIKEEIKNQIQKELEERFSAAIETEK